MDILNSKILLVDDTAANIDVLRETLENVGYNISAASTGEKALRILSRIKVDLILLDVMMPGLSGFDTCERLKENIDTANIPVIFITAKATPDDISNAFRLGAVDYVIKPFNNDEVLARVKTHLLLKKSNDSLLVVNEQKDKFLGMAAHDLRSPLSGVIGFLELLKDEITDKEVSKLANSALKACSTMKILIGDLLDASAINQGKLSLNQRQFDLGELVSERCEICKFSANKKMMEINLLNLNSLTCYGDRNRIGQVLDNLLTNAIKFSPQGSKITVEVLGEPNLYKILVSDCGPGLSDQDMEKLFSNFGTLSAKPTAAESSTGLGLAISKHVIDAHNGKLSAKNLMPAGACFTMEIPQ